MEIISSSKVLVSKFKNLIKTCDEISILTAWATMKNPLIEELQENSHKFGKIIVGLKFFQTDPEFIKNYSRTKQVRYIKNDTSGIYHPKVYLFEEKTKWHLFIGSPNLTKQGFGNNFEITSYATGNSYKDKIITSIKKIIEDKWVEASKMTKEEIKNYEEIHKIQKEKLKSLSGKYDKSKRKKVKPIYSIPLLNLSWSQFVKKVLKEEDWKVEGRIELLNKCNSYFIESGELLSMNKNQRQEIGGINSDQGLIYGSFGTMSARGYFTSYINNIKEKPLLSKALNEIPLRGKVNKSNYLNFIKLFTTVFSEANEIAGASRLLTIKRPDIFVNLNTKNKIGICNDLGISKNIGYEDYWDSIIKRIHDSTWWNNPEPKNKLERQIAEKRAAFLDSIYYEG